MPSFTAALVALAIFSFVTGKPIPYLRTGLTVHQSVAKPYRVGAVLLEQTYQKYGAAVPAVIAAASASSGSTAATPEEFDAEYLCPVTIGGQTFQLDFDTGSADL